MRYLLEIFKWMLQNLLRWNEYTIGSFYTVGRFVSASLDATPILLRTVRSNIKLLSNNVIYLTYIFFIPKFIELTALLPMKSSSLTISWRDKSCMLLEEVCSALISKETMQQKVHSLDVLLVFDSQVLLFFGSYVYVNTTIMIRKHSLIWSYGSQSSYSFVKYECNITMLTSFSQERTERSEVRHASSQTQDFAKFLKIGVCQQKIV